MSQGSMRAMVVAEFGSQPELVEVQKPIPVADEVLLRVRAAGVCHTDMKIRDGLVPGVSLPLTLGHEIAGEVASVGPGVQGVAVGARGVPYGYVTCGVCRYCTNGRTSLCLDLGIRYGFGPVGGYSEYVLVPERLFVEIPDEVGLEEAAVASCSLVTPYHALVKRAQLRMGETVVVIGAGGGVGLHAVQLAKRMGGYVIAVDADPKRLDHVMEQGADQFVVPGEAGFASTVLEATDGLGADVAIDIVASASTMADAVQSLAPGGRLVLVGYHPEVPFSAATPKIVFGEVDILGSHWATINDVIEVIDMIARGIVSPIIVREYPLEQASEALKLLASGGGPGRSVLRV